MARVSACAQSGWEDETDARSSNVACETALLSNTFRTPSVGRRAATQLAHVTDADEHPVLPPFMRFSKVVEGRILAAVYSIEPLWVLVRKTWLRVLRGAKPCPYLRGCPCVSSMSNGYGGFRSTFFLRVCMAQSDITMECVSVPPHDKKEQPSDRFIVHHRNEGACI